MRKFIGLFVTLTVFCGIGIGQTIVFDMKYKPVDPDYPAGAMARTTTHESLPEGAMSFFKGIGIKLQNAKCVEMTNFAKGQYTIVEINDGKPTTWYVDMNANGKFDANEKIEVMKYDSIGQTMVMNQLDNANFQTPEFYWHSKNNGKIKGQFWLNYFSSNKMFYCTNQIQFIGKAKVDGKEMELVLTDRMSNGNYCELGIDRFTMKEAGKMNNVIASGSLSEVIAFNNGFYASKFIQNGDKVKVELEPYTGEYGSAEIVLKGKQDKKLLYKLSNIYLDRLDNKTQFYADKAMLKKLPIGKYNIGCKIAFGTKKPYIYGMSASDMVLDIKANQVAKVEISKPAIKIICNANENNKVGDKILINVNFENADKQNFSRFYCQLKGIGYKSLNPRLTIVGSGEKIIAKKTLEYG